MPKLYVEANRQTKIPLQLPFEEEIFVCLLDEDEQLLAFFTYFVTEGAYLVVDSSPVDPIPIGEYIELEVWSTLVPREDCYCFCIEEPMLPIIILPYPCSKEYYYGYIVPYLSSCNNC